MCVCACVCVHLYDVHACSVCGYTFATMMYMPFFNLVCRNIQDNLHQVGLNCVSDIYSHHFEPLTGRDGSSSLVLLLKSVLNTFSKVLDSAFKHLTN